MANGSDCARNVSEMVNASFVNISINCSVMAAADPAEPEAETERTQRLVLLIPLIALVLITSGGNVVVMICTRIDKRLRTVSSLYVFSLAVADAIVGFAVMGPMTVYTINGMWPLGIDFCTTWMVFDFCCCTVSMLHLCLIAHDRYVALVHPMEYKNNRTTKDALIRIALAWVVGALAWIPCIVFIRYDLDQDNVDPLDCFFTYNKWFVLGQALVVYYMPIVVMSFFYVACLHVLRLRYKKTAVLGLGGSGGVVIFTGEASMSMSVSHGAPTAENQTVSTIMDTAGRTVSGEGSLKPGSFPQHPSGPGASSEEETTASAAADERKVKKRLSRQQQQLRSIRTLGLVIVVFLFCWIPFCSFWPISAFCPTCISLPAYEYSYWAAYLNSTVNPALYFVANRDFRSAFRKLVRWRTDEEE